MKELKNLNEKNALAIIVILSVVLLSIPIMFRIFTAESNPLGYNSYENVINSGKFMDDPGLIGADREIFNLYDMLTGLLSSVISLNSVLLALQFILGIASVILIYLVLRGLKTKKDMIFIITLLAVTSPAFFFTFSTSNPVSLSFFLNLAGFYLLMKRKRIFFVISLLIYSILPFMGLYPFLASLLPVLFSYRKNLRYKSVLIVSSAIFLCRMAWMMFFLGLPGFNASYDGAFFSYFISDLGVSGGFGVFLAFLFLVGVQVSIKDKKRYIPGYAYLSLLFILSLFDSSLFIFLSLPISYFAGFGVSRIFSRKWQLPYIRFFSLVLVICGFIFSAASFTNFLVEEGPSIEEIESLKWLKEFSKPGGIMLTDPSYGFFVEAISNKTAFADKGKNYFIDETSHNITSTIFESRNLDTTKTLLTDNRIRYIWISDKMKQEIWGKKEDGLLFLFRNNETFKKSYDHTSIEIWELKVPGDER